MFRRAPFETLEVCSKPTPMQASHSICRHHTKLQSLNELRFCCVGVALKSYRAFKLGLPRYQAAHVHVPKCLCEVCLQLSQPCVCPGAWPAPRRHLLPGHADTGTGGRLQRRDGGLRQANGEDKWSPLLSETKGLSVCCSLERNRGTKCLKSIWGTVLQSIAVSLWQQI